MNSANRRPAATFRRAVCGTLTTALLLGGCWGLAGTAASAAGSAPPTAESPAATGPYALGVPWKAAPAHVYGSWPSGRPRSWSGPVSFRVSARYGIRGNWKAGHHTGIDLAVPVGTPVRSVAAGTVVFSGTSGDYGKAVTVRMRGGRYTLFAHLSKRYVRKGARVKAGTLLARSGNTGRTTGPHLHFEVRTKRGYGSDVNPVPYLARHGVRIA